MAGSATPPQDTNSSGPFVVVWRNRLRVQRDHGALGARERVARDAAARPLGGPRDTTRDRGARPRRVRAGLTRLSGPRRSRREHRCGRPGRCRRERRHRPGRRVPRRGATHVRRRVRRPAGGPVQLRRVRKRVQRRDAELRPRRLQRIVQRRAHLLRGCVRRSQLRPAALRRLRDAVQRRRGLHRGDVRVPDRRRRLRRGLHRPAIGPRKLRRVRQRLPEWPRLQLGNVHLPLLGAERPLRKRVRQSPEQSTKLRRVRGRLRRAVPCGDVHGVTGRIKRDLRDWGARVVAGRAHRVTHAKRGAREGARTLSGARAKGHAR
jgi:hypothetical protein